jgi:hypothetical protein
LNLPSLPAVIPVIMLSMGMGTHTWEMVSAPWHLGRDQEDQHRPYLETRQAVT